MVDHDIVCSMCGDVGFPDKLFRCFKCRYRYQHSYCSNYYSEHAKPIQICDWCQCEERNSSSRHYGNIISSRNEINEEMIKKDESSAHYAPKGRPSATGKTPSRRPGGTRKYKLLKDVMC